MVEHSKKQRHVDIKCTVVGYLKYVALPASILVLTFEKLAMQTDKLRHDYQLITLGEHLFHLSKTEDYFSPKKGEQTLACPELQSHPLDVMRKRDKVIQSIQEGHVTREELSPEDAAVFDIEFTVAEFLPMSALCMRIHLAKDEATGFVRMPYYMEDLLQDLDGVGFLATLTDYETSGSENRQWMTLRDILDQDEQLRAHQISQAASVREVSIREHLQRKSFFADNFFLHEIADPVDVTMIAETRWAERLLDATPEIVGRLPRTDFQSQYICAMMGSASISMVSLYQTMILRIALKNQEHDTPDWWNPNVSTLDLNRDELLDAFPQLHHIDFVDVDIREAECLFIPAGWWYQIETIESEPTVLVSHWYDISSSYLDLISDPDLILGNL